MLIPALALVTFAASPEPVGPVNEPVDEPVDGPVKTYLYPEGTRMLTTEFKYAFGWSDEQDIPTLALGADYFVIDNLSLGVELQGLAVFQEGVGTGDTGVVALEARLRHHLVTWDDGLADRPGSFFLSAGGGPSYAHDPVPAGGSHFNFVSHAGVGLTQRLGDNRLLLGGLDYWHLSNANLPDGDNPSINGVQAFVGFGWTF